MIYYIQYPGDTEADVFNDNHILGEHNKFGFSPQGGYRILNRIVERADFEYLNAIVIIDQTGKRYTVEGFFKQIEK